jgi:hypothetical protein
MGARVGGIARTEIFNGYRMDIGGHRFFTKVSEVEAFWHEVLGEDFLVRPRLSRIYYNRQYIMYPLRFGDALSKLGVGQSFLVLLSYFRSKIAPYRHENTFEEWVSNRFGKRLYDLLQDLHGEGVGHPLQSTQRLVGGPAHSKPVAAARRDGRFVRGARREECEVADRGVSLSAARAGHVVGTGAAIDRAARRRSAL